MPTLAMRNLWRQAEAKLGQYRGVLETTVTLNAGAKTTIPVPVSYSCADTAAANGQSYTWVAVADHGADDLASCPPSALQGLACFNALADDDQDPADNRLSRNGPKVVAQ